MPNFSELHDAVLPQFSPIDLGYAAWTFDPVLSSGTPFTLTTGGTVYLAALKTLDRVITNVVYQITTAGGTLTSGQCFVGLYQNGALLAASADQSTAWGSTGLTTTALSAPVLVNQGMVYAAFFFNGTTGPTLATGAATTAVNAGFAAASSRFGTADTGRTTSFPATLGTVSALAKSPWVALS